MPMRLYRHDYDTCRAQLSSQRKGVPRRKVEKMQQLNADQGGVFDSIISMARKGKQINAEQSAGFASVLPDLGGEGKELQATKFKLPRSNKRDCDVCTYSFSPGSYVSMPCCKRDSAEFILCIGCLQKWKNRCPKCDTRYFKEEEDTRQDDSDGEFEPCEVCDDSTTLLGENDHKLQCTSGCGLFIHAGCCANDLRSKLPIDISGCRFFCTDCRPRKMQPTDFVLKKPMTGPGPSTVSSRKDRWSRRSSDNSLPRKSIGKKRQPSPATPLYAWRDARLSSSTSSPPFTSKPTPISVLRRIAKG